MPHISRRTLQKDIEAEISSKFAGTLLKLRTLGGRAFAEELLTPVEQIMLAKRLAIIFMLIEGRSYYRIIKTLGVSISTVKRLHEALLLGKFKIMERGFKKDKARHRLLNQLETLSRMGLPPRAGPRWGAKKKSTVL